MKPAPQSSVQEMESKLALWMRVGAFFLGVLILVVQVFAARPTFYLVAAGVGCLGPVVAQSVAVVIAAARGGGNE